MRYTNDMVRIWRKAAISILTLSVLVIPVSPNYDLRQLTIGDGGTGQSANFQSEQTSGDINGPLNSSSYKGGLGFGFTQMANVPPAPTFTNPANYYNKLHVVISQGNNPSDTVYALAISTDNFVTTQYVKNDTTVGNSLTPNDYQTYADWGGASGFDVIGLTPSTTFYIKAKANQGNFTESGFGPVSSATTAAPTLSFDIDVASSDTETAPPYVTNLGTLTAGTVTTGANKVWLDLDTNATGGGSIYVAGANNGLLSNHTSTLLAALSGDLASASSGFGLQANSATQTSGGPLSAVAPFDGSSDVVGAESTTFQTIFNTSNPIVGGRGSFAMKAKPGSLTPSSNDYSEILTVIAAANF